MTSHEEAHVDYTEGSCESGLLRNKRLKEAAGNWASGLLCFNLGVYNGLRVSSSFVYWRYRKVPIAGKLTFGITRTCNVDGCSTRGCQGQLERCHRVCRRFELARAQVRLCVDPEYLRQL